MQVKEIVRRKPLRISDVENKNYRSTLDVGRHVRTGLAEEGEFHCRKYTSGQLNLSYRESSIYLLPLSLPVSLYISLFILSHTYKHKLAFCSEFEPMILEAVAGGKWNSIIITEGSTQCC